MLHPLPARRHGQDPKVRYAEVGFVESLPPCLLITDELAQKAGLPEAFPCDRHRPPVGFEEEVGTPPVLWRSVELKAEDLIRLHAKAVGLPALSDLDLPAEGQAKPPGRLRSPREHLLGRDELHPLATPASDLERNHDLGDRKRVVKEHSRDVALLRLPPDAAPLQSSFPLEQLRAMVPQGIDEGLGPAGVPVELHGRAIKVAVMEEELQAPERRLPAP